MPSRSSEATSLERSQPAAGVRAFETGARSRERIDRPDSLLRGVLTGREEVLAGRTEGWEKFMSRNLAARVAMGFAFTCTGEHVDGVLAISFATNLAAQT